MSAPDFFWPRVLLLLHELTEKVEEGIIIMTNPKQTPFSQPDLQNCPVSVHSVLVFCLVFTTVSSLRQMSFATLIFTLLLVTQSVQS